MKKIIVVFSLFLMLSGCSVSGDCIKNSGAVTTKQMEVAPFDKIFVYPGIGLEITQGDEYMVSVKSGSNFIDDIEVKVSGDSLILKDNSGCNLVRNYGQTIVYVTIPNQIEIFEIYSNTEKTIRSNGVLTFTILRLFAMDNFGGVGTGDFVMDVNNHQLVIASNNVSSFFIQGQAQELRLNFYDGLGRFEGENFLAKSIIVFQRGSNDMKVHPVESITGDIYGTGDIISKTHPATVEVIEHYKGRLLFN